MRMGEHLMSLLGELRYEPVTRRVRASLDGVPVLDTSDAALVWEPRRIVPLYAVPRADLSASLVARPAAEVPDGLPQMLGPVHFEWHHTPGQSFDLVVGERTVPAAGFAPDDPDLGGRIVLDWAPFTGSRRRTRWSGHPTTRSSASTSCPASGTSWCGSTASSSPTPAGRSRCTRPTLACAGTSPTTMSSPTCSTAAPSTTTCAYKGHAAYVSLRPDAVPGLDEEARHDIAWTYPHPLHEVEAIKGMFCFWPERTDLELDGVAVARPVTLWSSPRDQDGS